MSKRHTGRARVGIILGSGLGAFAGSLSAKTVIPYRELPHFPVVGVAGHSGNLVFGDIDSVHVAVLEGRAHYYEGQTMAQVAYPTRLLGWLGMRSLIVTNAAGGIHTSFRPGDLMLITDHINRMGGNPLIGPNADELGERFPDMSEAYDREMRELALAVAAEKGILLRQGVYIAVPGPSYETPAEIRMFRTMGADAVGMSTVPEVIVAGHMGMGVLGISCITNMAAGILPQRLTHQEVIDTTRRIEGQFAALLRALVPRLAALAGEVKGDLP
ncbi:MAG: purine-nucleoside phosphorylase [Acidobacteriota bacterium]